MTKNNLEELKDRQDVGFPKDNNGKLLYEHPMQVFGDMVLLENVAKTTSMNGVTVLEGLEFSSDLDTSQELGAWEVVAVGDNVQRVQKGDIVGTPIGNSATPIQHPLIAKKVMVKDQHGNMVVAKKDHVDYVYVVVNFKLLGMKYM